MPELPEVETIVRSLRERLINLELSGVEVGLAKCFPDAQGVAARALHKKILAVERRGKNIIFRLSGGTALLVHLRMSGRLRFVPSSEPREKHTHVVFSFRGRSSELRFVDPRQFGRLRLEEKSGGEDPACLAELGPEPLEIDPADFIRRVRLRRREIKPLLLDQRFLAGVGNIYADEALHRAEIHPREPADRLGEARILRLYRELRGILRRAIRARGTSVRTYVDAGGRTGGFQKLLRVYGREGEACLRCGGTIRRERVGGRSSYFCPRCQRRPGRISHRGARSAAKPQPNTFTAETAKIAKKS